MKQIEAQIMGQAYKLACPEGSEAGLLEAVRRVDAAMTQIRDAGKIRARERIAVLAALNLAFEQIQAPPPETGTATEGTATEGAGPGTEPSADAARLGGLLLQLDAALDQEPQLF